MDSNVHVITDILQKIFLLLFVDGKDTEKSSREDSLCVLGMIMMLSPKSVNSRENDTTEVKIKISFLFVMIVP